MPTWGFVNVRRMPWSTTANDQLLSPNEDHRNHRSNTKYAFMHAFYRVTELNPRAAPVYYIHTEMAILLGTIIL